MEPRKNDLKKIFSTVNSAFTDVKGPLPGHYDEIRARELWALQRGGELIYSDFAFYNKETDFITFEHTTKRGGYFGGVHFRHTEPIKIETPLPAPWKICIFVKDEGDNLQKAWDALIPTLFDPNSPIQSGKLSMTGKEYQLGKGVGQIVLYTFSTESEPLNPQIWKAKLGEIEQILLESHIYSLR